MYINVSFGIYLSHYRFLQSWFPFIGYLDAVQRLQQALSAENFSLFITSLSPSRTSSAQFCNFCLSLLKGDVEYEVCM